jgi:hypothetical protein
MVGFGGFPVLPRGCFELALWGAAFWEEGEEGSREPFTWLWASERPDGRATSSLIDTEGLPRDFWPVAHSPCSEPECVVGR